MIIRLLLGQIEPGHILRRLYTLSPVVIGDEIDGILGLNQIKLFMLYSDEVLVSCYFFSELDRQRRLVFIGRLPYLRILIPLFEVFTCRVLDIRVLYPDWDFDSRYL